VNTAAREYDVILYGASGFTGRQTVAYFAQHAPHGLRWAIAGRTRLRLEVARAEAAAPLRAGDIIVADSEDPASVDAMVARTRVLLSTAGPFARYGTPVVDACVRFGTHYVDITGEPPWIREITARYHDRAERGGIRIVPCCGFDSIPSDLGAMLVARTLQHTAGVACNQVRGYFQLRGGLNGGTIASYLNMVDQRSAPPPAAPAAEVPSREHAAPRERHVRMKGPHYDREIGAWVGPFFMAPINTRVVRRSAELFARWGEPYGPEFVYEEQMKYDPPLAPVKAAITTAGMGVLSEALRRPWPRTLVLPLLPEPGSGPSARTMERGWFRCELIGFAESGHRIRGLIADRGDPGNRATVKLLCESALALALEFDALPGGPARGGVLTPATAIGDVLAARLRRAGMTIELRDVEAPIAR
jgi:short subunit dehydrogenase-like uncharacterized protein